MLGADDVRRALPMAEAIDAVRHGFEALHRGSVQMPTRLQVDADDGVSLFMPVHGAELARTCLKLVSVYPGNRDRDLPAINGLVVLVDGETGAPIAALEAASLTAIRTGAASGVATDLLARPDAATLGVIGAGAQAPDQAAAVCAVRAIRRIRLFNRTRERAEALAARLHRELSDVTVEVTGSAGEAIADADVVCTATNAHEPVLDADDVAPGTHVNAIGSFRAGMRELPRDLLARASRVVVDEVEAALHEAGEVIDAVESGVVARDQLVELGAALERGSGRREPDEITVFKSCGLAVQDLYAAARAVDNASRDGTGRPIRL